MSANILRRRGFEKIRNLFGTSTRATHHKKRNLAVAPKTLFISQFSRDVDFFENGDASGDATEFKDIYIYICIFAYVLVVRAFGSPFVGIDVVGFN